MCDVILLVISERLPPTTEFLSELDFPGQIQLCHIQNILYAACQDLMLREAGSPVTRTAPPHGRILEERLRTFDEDVKTARPAREALAEIRAKFTKKPPVPR